MALRQPADIREIVINAFGNAMYRYAGRLGERGMRELENRLADQVERGVQNANALTNIVYDYIRETGGQLGNQAFHIASGIANRVEEVWNQNEPNWGSYEDRMRLINEADQQLGERTTLDDLIPENTQGGTSDMEQVDNGGDVPMAAARMAASSSGGGNQVSKETPISTYPNLSYGLPDTHTTILPWTGWLSVGGLDKTTPAQLKLRMNTPFDMVDVTLEPDPAAFEHPSGKGFYRRPFDPHGRFTVAAGQVYPEMFSAGIAGANERPAWREYWRQLYEYYTVLGCEYEIIIHNPLQLTGARITGLPAGNSTNTVTADYYKGPINEVPLNCDLVCATQFDTFATVATSTGNVMPKTRYSEVRTYKNIQWYPIRSGGKQVIRGTYKPGQAKRNIVNDGEVKTWTPTKGAPGQLPNMNEDLTLNFWTDPFYNARLQDDFGTGDSPTTVGVTAYGVANMEINLKYIVQFKDLRLQARYPNTLFTDQDIIINMNQNIGASGNPLQSWNTAST